jgi:hypothetical protein
MNDQLTQQILARLDALAAKLGTTAVYLWGVLLQQAKIEAYTDFFIAGVCFVLFVGCLLVTKKSIKEIKKDEYDNEGWWIGAISSSIVGVILFGVSIAQTTDGIRILLNPAYWALQHIF